MYSLFYLLLTFLTIKTTLSRSQKTKATLSDLETLIESYTEPLSTLVTKNDLTLVLFADKSMLNNSDLRFFKQILKATYQYKDTGKQISFGFYDRKYSEQEKEQFFLYP